MHLPHSLNSRAYREALTVHAGKADSVVQHVVDGEPGANKYVGDFPSWVQIEVDTGIQQLQKASDPGCLAHRSAQYTRSRPGRSGRYDVVRK